MSCARTAVVLSLMAVLVCGCGSSASEGADVDPKAAVERVVRDSICWALTKDRALLESTMAHDEDLFIVWTESNSVTAGWNDFRKLFDTWMDPRFEATVTEIRDLRIHLSRSGDVAWYAATLDDLGKWDGKPTGARDIRWTGVLEKRGGQWVVVQMHGSVARDKAREQATP